MGANLNDRNSSGNTALHFAAENGHVEIIRILVIEAGVDPNVERSPSVHRGLTPLFSALRHADAVLALLELGADPNAQETNVNGRTLTTVLLKASRNGYLEVVFILLEAGADPNIRSSANDTPLHYAATNGHEKVARLLLVAGADRNRRDSSNRTPRDRAVERGHDKMPIFLKHL